MFFQELNLDQRREIVNSRQRFAALREAKAARDAHRGSLTWLKSDGGEYLVRSHYNKGGVRRQTSLGARSPQTEKMKSDFEVRRAAAEERWIAIRETMERQAAVNRALGLGRVPLTGARIIRALDEFGLLGSGIRILGTNAIFAYEAAAGVLADPGLTATGDIDLLLDARGGLTFVASDDLSEVSLLKILRRLDRSFERSAQTFRAINRDGYLVDLIKPMPKPPWKQSVDKVGTDANDLSAIDIEGLEWLQNAPPFEAIAIDERGQPTRIVAADPRVWAAHKLWLSRRSDREPIKRQRDAAQATAIAALVATTLTHLPFEADQLRMLPKQIVNDAMPLFTSNVAR